MLQLVYYKCQITTFAVKLKISVNLKVTLVVGSLKAVMV